MDAAGWKLPRGGVRPLHQPFRSEEEETDHGPADYALWLDNAIVGVVEAKRLTVGPQNVLTQAERYATGMAINILGRQAIFGLGDEAIDEDAAPLDIPIHAFDVIVADECHRGYTSQEISTWRSTLDHFDAIKIGLTATPASHTTAYFTHKVFEYPYEQAVKDGHLVDYDLVRVRSDARMNGLFLREGENVEIIDPQTGLSKVDQLEDEREFATSDLEDKITAPDSNRKIIHELKKYTDEHERQFKRFPKTLIFAVNDLPHTSHADQLVELAREVFNRGDAFVEKITGKVDRPLQKIREFRNRPNPGMGRDEGGEVGRQGDFEAWSRGKPPIAMRSVYWISKQTQRLRLNPDHQIGAADRAPRN